MPNLNDRLFAELLAAQLTQRVASAGRPCPVPPEPASASSADAVPPGITLYIERLQSENQALKIMLAQALSRSQASY